MRATFIGVIALSLAGCEAGAQLEPVPSATAMAIADASVLVADAETLIESTLDEYIFVTNRIVSGDAPADAINDLTTPEWAIEEADGFLALDALGGKAQPVVMTRWQLTAMRGRHTFVDALVSTCLGSATAQTHATVRMVPRDGAIVIDEISPWEDSTWCAVLPLR
jgi:hypothetical protein